MKNKSKINVYCGESIESSHENGTEIHPINQVKNALRMVEKSIKLKKNLAAYSNNPDFVSAIKYICELKEVEVQFFLNGKSQGSDIEKIFEDFNRAYDLLNDILGIEK
jgi:hypothetical protein